MKLNEFLEPDIKKVPIFRMGCQAFSKGQPRSQVFSLVGFAGGESARNEVVKCGVRASHTHPQKYSNTPLAGGGGGGRLKYSHGDEFSVRHFFPFACSRFLFECKNDYFNLN